MITRTDLLDKLQNGAVWNTGVTFERTNPVPIEKYSIFSTLAEAQTYAFENPVAYPGQTLAVVTDTNEVTLYIVQAGVATKEASLIEVGSATLGDGVSVELDTTSKTIKLKDFGKYYYREVVNTSTDEEGKEVTTITYEKVADFKAGLEPKVRLTDGGTYELAWYEPSSITVEGLSNRINSLTETVGTVEGVATDAQSKATTNASEISTLKTDRDNHELRLDQAESDIKTIQDTYATTEAVEQLIGEQAHFTTQVVNTTADVTESGVLYLIKDPTAVGQDVYKEYLFIDGAPVCIGDTTTNLANYYNKTEVDDKLSGKANSADVTTSINNLTQSISDVDAKFADYTTSAGLAEQLAGYYTKAETDAEVKKATDAAAQNATNIQNLTTTVADHTSDIADNTTAIENVNKRVDTTNQEIENVKTTIANLGDTYATDAEVAAIKEAIENTHAADKEELEASIRNKANTADVYTKNEVDTKLGDYNTKTEVDQKIAAIYSGSDSLADYITDNRDTIPGLLSTTDANKLGNIDSRLAALKINSTDEIIATANETSGGVDLTVGKVAVSKLESDVTLYLNCGDAETV